MLGGGGVEGRGYLVARSDFHILCHRIIPVFIPAVKVFIYLISDCIIKKTSSIFWHIWLHVVFLINNPLDPTYFIKIIFMCDLYL